MFFDTPYCAHLWLDLHFGLVQPSPLKSKHNFPAKAVGFQLGSPVLTPCTFFFRVKDCWLALYSFVAEESPHSELASSKMVEQLMKQQTNSKTPHQQLPKISVVATFGATKIVCRMTAILSLHVVLRQCEPPGHISTFLEPYVDVH